jgi:hypothetical protein
MNMKVWFELCFVEVLCVLMSSMKVWIEVCFDWVLKYDENEMWSMWFMLSKWHVEIFMYHEKDMREKHDHESKCMLISAW